MFDPDEIPENKKRIRIVRDETPMDPRREFDSIGTMVCFHKRYNLGDKTGLSGGDFSGWGELEAFLAKDRGAVVILPVYMYDHSGITIQTTPFSCPWDSGQIGFIYATEEAAKDAWPSLSGEALLKAVKDCLVGEVELYDSYLRGAVYGYVVEEFVTLCHEDESWAGGIWQELDSCWGYYGDDWKTNGIKDDVQSYLDEGYTVEEED